MCWTSRAAKSVHRVDRIPQRTEGHRARTGLKAAATQNTYDVAAVAESVTFPSRRAAGLGLERQRWKVFCCALNRQNGARTVQSNTGVVLSLV